MRTRLGWHFVGQTLRDGRPVPPDGEWLRHDGECVPCVSGLHASAHVVDALRWSESGGPILCRVECHEPVVEDGDPPDKWCGPDRKILKRIYAPPLLTAWARRCALGVIDLWPAPDSVREYLMAGAGRRIDVTSFPRKAFWCADPQKRADNYARQSGRCAVMASCCDPDDWLELTECVLSAAAHAARASARFGLRNYQRRWLEQMVVEAMETGRSQWTWHTDQVWGLPAPDPPASLNQ